MRSISEAHLLSKHKDVKIQTPKIEGRATELRLREPDCGAARPCGATELPCDLEQVTPCPGPQCPHPEKEAGDNIGGRWSWRLTGPTAPVRSEAQHTVVTGYFSCLRSRLEQGGTQATKPRSEPLPRMRVPGVTEAVTPVCRLARPELHTLLLSAEADVV